MTNCWRVKVCKVIFVKDCVNDCPYCKDEIKDGKFVRHYCSDDNRNPTVETKFEPEGYSQSKIEEYCCLDDWNKSFVEKNNFELKDYDCKKVNWGKSIKLDEKTLRFINEAKRVADSKIPKSEFGMKDDWLPWAWIQRLVVIIEVLTNEK